MHVGAGVDFCMNRQLTLSRAKTNTGLHGPIARVHLDKFTGEDPGISRRVGTVTVIRRRDRLTEISNQCLL